jgi:hypothetical protein
MAEEDKVEVQEEVGEVKETVQVEEELSTQDVLEKELARMQGDSENETPTFEEAQKAQAEDIEASKEETTEDVTTPQQEYVGDTEEQGEEIKLSDEDNEFMGNLKPKAQERFKHWIDRANKAEAQIEENTPATQVFEHISDSTTNPDQLNWALDIFKGLNSGDYDNAKEALEALDKFSDQIAQKLGVNSTSDNEAVTYKDFEDLSKAVEDLDMSEEWATKLAHDRTTTNSRLQARSEFEKAQAETQEQQVWYNNEADKAYKEIQDWEKEIVDSDADYNLKKEIMMDIGSQIANSNMAPTQWLGTLKREYDVLTRGMAAASSKIPKASKGDGPLAPAGNSGSHSDSGYLTTPEVTPEFLQEHLDRMHS